MIPKKETRPCRALPDRVGRAREISPTRGLPVSSHRTVTAMARDESSSWDGAVRSLAAAVPDGTFLILAAPGDWRLLEWSPGSAGELLSLSVPDLFEPLQLPVSPSMPTVACESLAVLAECFGTRPDPLEMFEGLASFPSPPRGIDGGRQNPGSRPAPVLDPGAGVLGCSSCVGKGVQQTPCPCSPSSHLWHSPCSLCRGTRVLSHMCQACGGAGHFLWPATLSIARRDGLAGLSGDSVVAVPVDLSACDISIERSLLDSGDGLLWEDRWVVDLFRPFVQGCRDLGVIWPDAVVWVGDAPTIAARVSTAFSLLRLGTPTPRELALQPHLDQWIVREGPASIPEVLDPEHLGLHAASVVARLSRGVVVVSPLPAPEQLLQECADFLAPSSCSLAFAVVGPVITAVALDADLSPVGLVATGASMAEVLLNTRWNLERR
jgi:hypothetical protein